ncbi:MAG: DNA circularization N-terminal domain-containing protein [Acidobacteria bacterium]|nr:DNA circularization N-terminal domain-containing protein [Acidobacteriota bacterium]
MARRGYSPADFRPGSFRGVPFHVPVVEDSGGRRNVDHEVVDGIGSAEDTGRRPRTYSVTAVVIGEGYVERGATLLEALDAGQPGTLVHPVFGSISVVIDTWRRKFNDSYGAMIFTFECHDSGDLTVLTPVTVPDVTSWADALQATLETEFTGSWGVLDEALDTATEAYADVVQATGAVIDAVRRYADPSKVGAVLQQIENLTSAVEALVHTPGDLVDAFRSLLDPLVDCGPSACLAAGAAIAALETDDETPTITANRAALARLVRGVCAQASCRALVDGVTTGLIVAYDDAVALLDQTAAYLQTVADESGDAAVYRALADLRGQTWALVQQYAVTLPRLRTWDPPRAMSVFEVAQRVYGETAQATIDAIMRRNGVEDPAWISAELRLLVGVG